jgi:hypothetical protein
MFGTTELLVQLDGDNDGEDPNSRIQVTVLEVKKVGDRAGLIRGDTLPIEVKNFIEPSDE